MRPDSSGVRQALLRSLPEGAALCVAFSGGRDSTVLLHALARLCPERRFVLRAVHVNHGIQAAAAGWPEHCATAARRLGVPFVALSVQIRNERGRGLEAEAREARYAALREVLRPAEWLLTAHHADDQLETVLLHLFRGSGVGGLAGIPRAAPFGPGRLCRPLLDVGAGALTDYAAEYLTPDGFGWLTDPMNADVGYDRGFIRHEVTSVLRQRFPAAARAAGRSAALAAEAAGLLDELARLDARDVVAGNRLSLAGLGRLAPARQRNLVRAVARERGWATPPERRLREGLAQLVEAGPCRQPVLAWGGHEIRRFREHLHLLDVAVPPPGLPTAPVTLREGERLDLGAIRGQLSLQRAPGPAGLAPQVVAGGLGVVFRAGGERVRPGTDHHHRSLKYLFQTHGIVPWMRNHVPLIFSGDRLAAVADLWLAEWALAAPGTGGLQIVWTGHAPIW